MRLVWKEPRPSVIAPVGCDGLGKSVAPPNGFSHSTGLPLVSEGAHDELTRVWQLFLEDSVRGSGRGGNLADQRTAMLRNTPLGPLGDEQASHYQHCADETEVLAAEPVCR